MDNVIYQQRNDTVTEAIRRALLGLPDALPAHLESGAFFTHKLTEIDPLYCAPGKRGDTDFDQVRD